MEIKLTATEIREDIEAFEDRLQEAKEGLDSLPVTATTSGHGQAL